MSNFIASGQAVDLILAIIGAEVSWLLFRRRADIIVMLLPGVMLLLALRAAQTGAPWWHVAAWLTASLPAHLYDLRRRLSHRRN